MKKLFVTVCTILTILTGCSSAEIEVLPVENFSVTEETEAANIDTTTEETEAANIDTTTEEIEAVNLNTAIEEIEAANIDTATEEIEAVNLNTAIEEIEAANIDTATEDNEELKQELINMGLLRDATEKELNQYNLYASSVKNYYNNLSSSESDNLYQETIDQYKALLELIIANNEAFGVETFVEFNDKVVEPAVSPALPLKRAMLFTSDENYLKKYSDYEEQYELCYKLDANISRALREKEYYRYVKLIHSYTIEEEKLFELARNLE